VSSLVLLDKQQIGALAHNQVNQLRVGLKNLKGIVQRVATRIIVYVDWNTDLVDQKGDHGD
jgi:hypothetical protein